MNYEEARRIMKDGDVLQYQGTGFQSETIKLVTGSEYSHTAVVIWWGNRLMVGEATSRGVFPVFLSENIKHYHGSVYLLQAKDLTDMQRAEIVDSAKMQFGKEYSTWKLVKFAHHLLWRTRSKNDKYKAEVDLFCSEFVSSIYNKAGADPAKDLADSYTAPEDFNISPIFNHLGVIEV